MRRSSGRSRFGPGPAETRWAWELSRHETQRRSLGTETRGAPFQGRVWIAPDDADGATAQRSILGAWTSASVHSRAQEGARRARSISFGSSADASSGLREPTNNAEEACELDSLALSRSIDALAVRGRPLDYSRNERRRGRCRSSAGALDGRKHAASPRRACVSSHRFACWTAGTACLSLHLQHGVLDERGPGRVPRRRARLPRLRLARQAQADSCVSPR